MSLIERRRAMMAAKAVARTVTWFDVTLTAEATAVSTAQVGSAFVTDYNTEQPKRIVIRFYPVTPTEGTVSQSARMSLWRSGVSQLRNFCSTSAAPGDSTKKSFNCTSDGSGMAMECVLEQTSGKAYSFTLTTNTGDTNSNHYTWDPNSRDYFTVRNASKLGVGTRLVVTAEY